MTCIKVGGIGGGGEVMVWSWGGNTDLSAINVVKHLDQEEL